MTDWDEKKRIAEAARGSMRDRVVCDYPDEIPLDYYDAFPPAVVLALLEEQKLYKSLAETKDAWRKKGSDYEQALVIAREALEETKESLLSNDPEGLFAVVSRALKDIDAILKGEE